MTHVTTLDKNVKLAEIRTTGNPPPGQVADQDTLAVAANEMDSMFYYRYPAVCVDTESNDSCTENIAIGRLDQPAVDILSRIIDSNYDNTAIAMDTIPNWQVVRKNTYTLAVGIENKEYVQSELVRIYGHNTLVLDTGSYLRDVDRTTPHVHGITPLIYCVNTAPKDLRGAMAKYMVIQDALEFMADTANTVYPDGYHSPVNGQQAVGYSKWYIQAEWLSRELHRLYPYNFRNIVIFGAAELFATEKLKLTKLQRFLADCGRLDTKLILVD